MKPALTQDSNLGSSLPGKILSVFKTFRAVGLIKVLLIGAGVLMAISGAYFSLKWYKISKVKFLPPYQPLRLNCRRELKKRTSKIFLKNNRKR